MSRSIMLLTIYFIFLLIHEVKSTRTCVHFGGTLPSPTAMWQGPIGRISGPIRSIMTALFEKVNPTLTDDEVAAADTF